MTPQELGDRRFANASSLVGRGRALPEVEQPSGAEVAFKIEHGGKIAPKLLAHAVCEPVALGIQIFGDARPLAQFDNSGIGGDEQPETARIGAQSGGHNQFYHFS